MKRRAAAWLIVLGGFLCLAAVAAWYRYQDLNYITSDYAFVNAPAVWVSAPALGRVTRMLAGPGDRVAKGAPLLDEVTASGQHVTVRAPARGRVGPAMVFPGSEVLPGSDLIGLVETGHEDLVAEIPEASIQNVATGDVVDVMLTAYPGTTFNGTVAHIGRATLNQASPLLPSTNAFTKQQQYVPIIVTFTAGGPSRLFAGETATIRVHI
jgi:membrane fusion protein (multidrug efflux system)